MIKMIYALNRIRRKLPICNGGELLKAKMTSKDAPLPNKKE